MDGRVVNLKYTVGGLKFDAAIDCDWCLHDYGGKEEGEVPIEIYCLDRKDWDVRVFFQHLGNDLNGYGVYYTAVDLEDIIKKTKEWIKDMREDEIIEKDVNDLF